MTASAPDRGARARAGLGLVACLVFSALAAGGAAGAHPYDVGELAAAAMRLGGSHAPGQPLHALLGHAVRALPLGPFVLRLSWLSALGAALAAYGAGRSVLALVGRVDRAALALASGTMLAVACLPAVLRNAMRPEVYTCALACVGLASWALSERAQGGKHGLRVAAVLAAIAFALHPPHALAIAGMGLVACVARRPTRTEAVSSILLGLVVTAALLAYLPLRAAAGAPCWGDPTTVAGFVAYVSGAAYRRNLGGVDRGGALDVAWSLFVTGGAPALLALSAWRRRALATSWAFAAVAIIAALLQPLEAPNPDNVAYGAPALLLVLVAGAATLDALTRERAWAPLSAALLPLGALGASIAGGCWVPADLPALETLAFETIGAPGPRALLVTRTDFVSGAAMQSREVDGDRPDVALFVEGLATSSWHWRSLRGHPLFDGRPHRGPGDDVRDAYVRGALDLARDRVELAVENGVRLAGQGVVRGALLVHPPASEESRVDDRATAERTMGALAAAIPDGRAGDHEAGAQVLRHVVIARAEWLFDRHRGARARSELARAAELPAGALAPLGDGPFERGAALTIHDRRFFLGSREDVVREVAVMLDRRGRALEATRLLEAQQARGDDRAIAQLAALQLADGLLAPAQQTFAAYRALHPDDRSADVALLERALASAR